MKWLLLVGFFFVTTTGQAQTTYPGSMWSSNGTLSPAEKGNVLSMTHAEQGVRRKGIEGFVVSDYWVDSKRFDWNNRLSGGLGLRFTQTVKTGMVRAGIAYINEKRTISGNIYNGIRLQADCYFQWKLNTK